MVFLNNIIEYDSVLSTIEFWPRQVRRIYVIWKV